MGGLGNHIQSLKEMVVFPLLYPEVFERFKIQPPRSVEVLLLICVVLQCIYRLITALFIQRYSLEIKFRNYELYENMTTEVAWRLFGGGLNFSKFLTKWSHLRFSIIVLCRIMSSPQGVFILRPARDWQNIGGPGAGQRVQPG